MTHLVHIKLGRGILCAQVENNCKYSITFLVTYKRQERVTTTRLAALRRGAIERYWDSRDVMASAEISTDTVQ